MAGTSIDIAGASLEEASEESAEETADDTAELIADEASDDSAADEDEASEEDTAEDDTAAEEDDAASLELTTADDDGAGALELTAADELEGATGVTGVGVPRLKIQIRPMITITATMMIIQVLRFILLALFWRRPLREFLR